MAHLALHHVSIIVTDLPRSLAFYQKVFGLTIIERPPFNSVGAWLGCGALQVHLTLYLPGSFRTGNIDGEDCRTSDTRIILSCSPPSRAMQKRPRTRLSTHATCRLYANSAFSSSTFKLLNAYAVAVIEM